MNCIISEWCLGFQIEELNLLPEEVEKLAEIWIKLKEYALMRLTTEMDEQGIVE